MLNGTPNRLGANEETHGVPFPKAATVFGDPLAITDADPDHSEDEDRFLTFWAFDRREAAGGVARRSR